MTRIELRDFAVWMLRRPFRALRLVGPVLGWGYRVIAHVELFLLVPAVALLGAVMVAVYDSAFLNGAWDLSLLQQFGIHRVPLYASWAVILLALFLIRSLATFRREREQLLRHLRG